MKRTDYSSVVVIVVTQLAQSSIMSVTRACARARAGNRVNEPLRHLRP